jgi:beta-aspartyl-dipeptidase (metallo-type)
MLLLLRGGSVFAPEPLGICDLLVGGGKILAIAPKLPPMEAFAPAPVTEISLQGARVIPGLLDAHVHSTGGGGEAGPHTRVPAVPLSAFTLGGITTVVGLLGTDGTTRSMENLVAATNALRVEGLSAYCWTGGYEVPPVTLSGSVRRDIAFVEPIVGVGEMAISDHRSSQPTFEEFIRIAADCHVGGLMTGKAGILHLHLGDGKRGLSLVRRALDETELPPRVFYPTHVNRNKALFDEALAIAPRGVTVDVTAFPVEEGEDAWSAEDAIERYWAAGGPDSRITCSSDGGGCLPTFNGQGELVRMDFARPSALAGALRALLDRGHPLERVLPVFTSNVANLLRLHQKGRIAVGTDADLVVLSDEHHVRDVLAGGRVVVRHGVPTVRGTFE